MDSIYSNWYVYIKVYLKLLEACIFETYIFGSHDCLNLLLCWWSNPRQVKAENNVMLQYMYTTCTCVWEKDESRELFYKYLKLTFIWTLYIIQYNWLKGSEVIHKKTFLWSSQCKALSKCNRDLLCTCTRKYGYMYELNS